MVNRHFLSLFFLSSLLFFPKIAQAAELKISDTDSSYQLTQPSSFTTQDYFEPGLILASEPLKLTNSSRMKNIQVQFSVEIPAAYQEKLEGQIVIKIMSSEQTISLDQAIDGQTITFSDQAELSPQLFFHGEKSDNQIQNSQEKLIYHIAFQEQANHSPTEKPLKALPQLGSLENNVFLFGLSLLGLYLLIRKNRKNS